MRKERDLQDAVGNAELVRPRPEFAFERRPAMRHGHQSDLHAGLLESPHRGEQRERSLGLAELAVDAEIGTLACEARPTCRSRSSGSAVDLGRRRGKIERRPFGREQILRHFEAATPQRCARDERRA